MMNFIKYIFVAVFFLCFSTNAISAVNNSAINSYTASIYSQFHFTSANNINPTTFKNAVIGYLNIKEAKKSSSNILTICDFNLSANQKRMWVLDMKKKKILLHTYVAHGQGSGEEYASRFSNIEDSHQSSLGFYITGPTYFGNNGESLKLYGIDGNFNNRAFNRDIVVHGADYVNESYIRNNGRLGRSHGCPAVSRSVSPYLINTIKNGSVLFIYQSNPAYSRSSYWLNNTITSLKPEENMLAKKPTLKIDEEDDEAVFVMVPKTENDSISMGLIKPNSKLKDGSIFLGKGTMTKEELESFKKRNNISDLAKTESKKNYTVIDIETKSEEKVELNKEIPKKENKFPIPTTLQGKNILNLNGLLVP